MGSRCVCNRVAHIRLDQEAQTGEEGKGEKVEAAWDSGRWQGYPPVGPAGPEGSLEWGTRASELAREGCLQQGWWAWLEPVG